MKIEKLKEELKPCPFCGGKAELKNAMNSLRHIEHYSPYVSCGRCYASMFGGMTTGFFKATPEQVREGLTELFKKWNTRA